jgi:hypothetical protein
MLPTGIAREAARLDLDDKWFGQQAVYRVSLGSFVGAAQRVPERACDGTAAWMHAWSAWRLSATASFLPQLFFATMSCIMVGVKYRSDQRDKYLHHGNWLLKLFVWMLFVAVPFLFPTSVIGAYGEGR